MSSTSLLVSAATNLDYYVGTLENVELNKLVEQPNAIQGTNYEFCFTAQYSSYYVIETYGAMDTSLYFHTSNGDIVVNSNKGYSNNEVYGFQGAQGTTYYFSIQVSSSNDAFRVQVRQQTISVYTFSKDNNSTNAAYDVVSGYFSSGTYNNTYFIEEHNNYSLADITDSKFDSLFFDSAHVFLDVLSHLISSNHPID